MDAPLDPPVRFCTTKSTEASVKTVQGRLEAFLGDFQARSTPAKGGNTTVIAQLQKLTDALREERQRKKEKNRRIGMHTFTKDVELVHLL